MLAKRRHNAIPLPVALTPRALSLCEFHISSPRQSSRRLRQAYTPTGLPTVTLTTQGGTVRRSRLLVGGKYSEQPYGHFMMMRGVGSKSMFFTSVVL